MNLTQQSINNKLQLFIIAKWLKDNRVNKRYLSLEKLVKEISLSYLKCLKSIAEFFIPEITFEVSATTFFDKVTFNLKYPEQVGSIRDFRMSFSEINFLWFLSAEDLTIDFGKINFMDNPSMLGDIERTLNALRDGFRKMSEAYKLINSQVDLTEEISEANKIAIIEESLEV